jgi:hypothetical protein
MQRKALNAKKNVKPLSPIVINFELAAWLMRVLSDGHNSNNHSPGGNDLIEINLAHFSEPGTKTSGRSPETLQRISIACECLSLPNPA